jgi:spermidine synthase
MEKDETWRIFEIDPVMVEIASGDENFTFIENCMPDPDIQIGDARLTLAKEADASFDLLIVDAFSSDAVPVHLMTAEALKLYLAKLKPDGVVLLHISNRYLDLDAVLGATAAAVPEAHGYLLSDDVADGSYAQSTSTVALFAKSREALVGYESLAEMKALDASAMRPWTDDYSDILKPFLSKYRRRFGE